jgi:hypothetical protein
MGFEGVEKNRRSPDAISPEGTGQSVARHGSAGKDFTQIESRRDDTMGSSHANSLAHSLLAAANGENYVPALTVDGVHPSAAGYAVMTPHTEQAP